MLLSASWDLGETTRPKRQYRDARSVVFHSRRRRATSGARRETCTRSWPRQKPRRHTPEISARPDSLHRHQQQQQQHLHHHHHHHHHHHLSFCEGEQAFADGSERTHSVLSAGTITRRAPTSPSRTASTPARACRTSTSTSSREDARDPRLLLEKRKTLECICARNSNSLFQVRRTQATATPRADSERGHTFSAPSLPNFPWQNHLPPTSIQLPSFLLENRYFSVCEEPRARAS